MASLDINRNIKS